MDFHAKNCKLEIHYNQNKNITQKQLIFNLEQIEHKIEHNQLI